ncbi:hypothetical protein FAZ95_11065 [Trinickia violacea]|uniref:Uncharacterized protein n=1 Tax=Trinickia violacea TaxID=2571746 RepID=A0A4P8IMX1_9BURK|nr:hypothetical protein FAZ95_11065 [Trinickia violacea]
MFSRSGSRSCCRYPCYLLAEVCDRCRARCAKSETTSLEFILNPFKFFFTNNIVKSAWRHSQLGNADSVTYNLVPGSSLPPRSCSYLRQNFLCLGR